MTDTILINKLPTNTWNHLGVNYAKADWNEADSFLYDSENIIVDGNEGRPLNLSISDFEKTKNFGRKTVSIRAKSGSNVIIYEDCTAERAFDVKLKIFAEAESEIRLIQLLNPSDAETVLIHKTEVLAEANSKTDIITVMLGSGDVYSDNLIELKGDGSSLNACVAYAGRKAQIIDYNIVINHYGKSTSSNIDASGSLADAAKKTFRGTIDFKKGSGDSKGTETETVLMLGDEVVNKTVPLILCAEENVEGNHGATIGRLDKNVLLYFESRGIDAAAAEKIMACAAVEKLIKMFDNQALAEKALGLIGIQSDFGEE